MRPQKTALVWFCVSTGIFRPARLLFFNNTNIHAPSDNTRGYTIIFSLVSPCNNYGNKDALHYCEKRPICLAMKKEIRRRRAQRLHFPSKGLQMAVKAAGNMSILADGLGLTPQAVRAWKLVPVHHLKAIEKITGIPREQLRPDIFR